MKKLWVILFVLPLFSTSRAELLFFQVIKAKTTADTFSRDYNQAKPVKPLEIWDVNLKANRDFIQRFPATEHAEWFKISDGYMACFNQGEKKTRVGYDNKGNWIYNMYSYPVNQLPKDIRHTVIFSYPDSRLIWATEINKSKQVIYIVQISENGQLKSIWITEDDIHEIVN